MKLIDSPVKYKSSQIQEKHQFRLELNAKAFQILAKNLYSNPIKAIIRELSTNALDSQTQNGNPETPFKVDLPTFTKPNFTIRDYGVGLSPEQIKEVYTVFFRSDKTHSNDFIGTLGIGAKSVFAYTNSFLVTSYCDGKKYNYVVATGEDGIPEINLLSTHSSNERQGVEVSFTVKSDDFYLFEEEAKEIYKWFKIKPQTSIEFYYEETPFFEGENYTINQVGESVAVMGSIAYPIDSIHFKKSVYQDLLNLSLVINFNIGDLEITPSREELLYNKTVIQIIESKLDFILKDLENKFNDKINQAKHLFEARQIYQSYSYKIKKLFKYLNLTFNQANVCESHFEVETNLGLLTDYGNSYRVEKTKHFSIEEKTKVFLMDVPRSGYKARILNKYAEPRSFYIIEDTEDHKKLMEKAGLPWDEVIRLSTLKKPPAIKQQTRNPQSRLYYYCSKIARRNGWIDHKMDFKQGGVYVKLFRYEPVGYTNFTLANCEKIFQYLKITDKIYGILPKDHDRAEKLEQWVDLKIFVEEKIQELFKDQKWKNHYINYRCFYEDKSPFLEQILNFEIGDFINDDLNILRNQMKEMKKHEDLMYSLYSIGIKIDFAAKLKEIKSIKEKYPLLKHLEEEVFIKDKLEVLNYINSKG